MADPKKERYFLRSLANGIKALEAIAEANPSLSLSQLAGILGTSKATATRICYTLSELELLQRNENNKFELTPNVLKLGYGAISRLQWREIAKFYLENLSKEIQETVSLSVLNGTEVIFLLRIRKGDFFPFDVGIGARLPAHCTSMGKVLVAFSPPKKKKLILENMTFRSLTVHSITSREAFIDEINEAKEKGFAINYEEVSIGVCGVSAPIINKKGEAIAAISISSSTAKYSKSDIEKNFAQAIVQSAKQISEALTQLKSPQLK